MDSQLENKLYERFPHLYRERSAPLESSRMGWGFQCDAGWYKIIYEMSKEIQKLAGSGEFAPAITEVRKNKDGTLYVEARNLTPPIADIITNAHEKSRLTCEFCSYQPAFQRAGTSSEGAKIACGRCCVKTRTSPHPARRKGSKRPRRAPDTIVVKR